MATFPRSVQLSILKRLAEPEDEHSKDIERKRSIRSRAAEVTIPEPLDIKRRELCLADPERLLRTYFKPIFYNPFVSHHKAMIAAIWDRAWSGGDKSEAAPRGDGKSQIAICMTIAIMLGTPISFPVLIGNTLSKGKKLFNQVKSKFRNTRKYPEFCGDFPEICACVAGLNGAPQRAPKQHVNGILTEIEWSQHIIVMPYVSDMSWGDNSFGGKRLVYFGLDSAIRGEGFEELRPDIAIIDDPETREVAFSPTNRHEDIEDMINGDVAGLSGPDKKLSRVVLTTIQNRSCYSWRVTDKKKYATFAGDRHPLLSSWPDEREKWDEYIAIRQREQSEGLKDAPGATKLYLDDMESMKAGAVITNPYRFVSETNSDGDPVEVDALQAFFNRVADWGLARVLAELQQAPQEEETEQSLNLTPGAVANRISGFRQHKLPPGINDIKISVGLDMGNLWSHWVKIAWFGNATGVVIDYGILETPIQKEVSIDVLTRMMVPALLDWRVGICAENPPDFCLIDSGSGSHRDAIYEFVRRAGGVPFAALKGGGPNRKYEGADDDTTRYFYECYAKYQATEKVWLYHANSLFWRQWAQERFATPTFNENHQFNDGSLSLFVPDNPKRHLTISHHVTSEENQSLFVEGKKGLVTTRVYKSKNNHYLLAIAYACAAAGCLGIRMVQRVAPIQNMPIKQSQPTRPALQTPHGQPFLATERR